MRSKKCWMPPMIKFEITSPKSVFETLDVTDDVINWREIEIVYERDGTTGVLAESSFPIELCRSSRDFVRGLFERDGMYAKANINIYKRDDHILDKYTLIKGMPLNFATYAEYNNRIEISGVNVELAELVNSVGRIKHDISVRAIADSKKWSYQRILMLNSGTYTPVSEGSFSWFYGLPIHLSRAEMMPNSPEHDIRSQPQHAADSSEKASEYYLFKAASPVSITLNLTFLLDVEIFTLPPTASPTRLEIRSWQSEAKQWRVVKYFTLSEPILMDNGKYTQALKFDNEIIEADLEVGDTLSVALKYYHIDEGKECKYAFSDYNVDTPMSFGLTYATKGEMIPNISVINPQRLLQYFLDIASEKPNHFIGEINWRAEEFKTMICAAETLRGFNKPYLHGSMIDFMDWMRVLGYEHEVIGNKMIYHPRDYFFNKNITALVLKESMVKDLVVKSDDKYAYTGVEIGYEKQDYDSINGRFEANFAHEYTTGYISAQDNILKFISPYRADSIGIELLAGAKRDKTTDNKADNDIFFVAMTEEAGAYKEYKGAVISTGSSEIKLFNAVYNPRYLVGYNESLLGINSKELLFASTEGNRSARINGTSTTRDVVLTKRIFKPILHNFETGNVIPLPDADVRNGVIHFIFQGKRRKGFIDRIVKNSAFEQIAEWQLWEVED